MKPNFSGEYVLNRPASVLSTDEDTLVSEDRLGSGDAAMIMTWRYELLHDGRRLRATERVRGAGRDQDNVWEFDRT